MAYGLAQVLHHGQARNERLLHQRLLHHGPQLRCCQDDEQLLPSYGASRMTPQSRPLKPPELSFVILAKTTQESHVPRVWWTI